MTKVVQVQVTVAENGKVVAATAFHGPENLRAIAEQFVRECRFRPLIVAGEQVQTYGVLTLQF